MATNSFELKVSNWTDLGPSPCTVQITGESPITFFLEEVVPSSVMMEGHLLGTYGAREEYADIGVTSGHVFARALFGVTKVVVSR